MESASICAICAWRENCKKKFLLSGKDLRCPDYTRDISIRDKPEEAPEPESGKAG